MKIACTQPRRSSTPSLQSLHKASSCVEGVVGRPRRPALVAHLASSAAVAARVSCFSSQWSAASRQLVAPHGWGNPAGCVDTPASPVLPLEVDEQSEDYFISEGGIHAYPFAQ